MQISSLIACIFSPVTAIFPILFLYLLYLLYYFRLCSPYDRAPWLLLGGDTNRGLRR